MRAFFEAGGRLIDSSPMYGSSQHAIGYGLRKLGMPQALFAADKVWIASGVRGPAQIEESRAHWSVRRFDLLQSTQPVVVAGTPAADAVRDESRRPAALRRHYDVGGRRHGDVEAIMRKEPLDFVQVTYNAIDRDVEARILPLARDRGIAVIVNRPFQQGALIAATRRAPLPAFAADVGCTTWAGLLLKFIAAHPPSRARSPRRHNRHMRAREHGRCARRPARRSDAAAHRDARGEALGTI